MSDQSTIVDQAELFCALHKERLTTPRLEVLKIIAGSLKPLGAYEVLKRLGEVIKSPKPPTAYRAIDFWEESGFIHRIESLNAYLACHADHKHKGGQFIICDGCGMALEIHICKLPESLKKNTEENQFAPLSWSVEVHGLCEKCQAV